MILSLNFPLTEVELHIPKAGHILNSNEVGVSNAFKAAAVTTLTQTRGECSQQTGKARKAPDQKELRQTIGANSRKSSTIVLCR